jgi:hypothetical protein
MQNNDVIDESKLMSINAYIDNELVSRLLIMPNPITDIFNPMLNGAKIVYVEDCSKIPTIGMKYINEEFVQGDNEESFYTAEELKNLKVESLIAIIDDKVVATFVADRYCNTNMEGFFAAMLSDASITIENNYI